MPRSRPPTSASRRTALASAGALGLALATRGLMATAQEATPATTFSTFGHLLVGTWQWTDFSDSPRIYLSSATFAENGRYVEFSDTFVAIGNWRATGERTAEVVLLPGVPISLDAAFEPGYQIAETCLVTRDMTLLRIMIEIDPTGDHMTGAGWFELPASDNRVVKGSPYEGTGDRMTLAPGGEATPIA